MTTPPDKCPKCASDTPRTDNETGDGQGKCGRVFVKSEFCRQLERELTAEHERAEKLQAELTQSRAAWHSLNDQLLEAFLKLRNEHDRAEKWKACADGLAWDFVQYLGDAYSPNKATYDALMKEEQK